MTTDAKTQKLSIDTIRALAMDGVQKAGAGHPGTAMALAPLAYLLYRRVMRHNPANPDWPNRDRFILSAGHACILQYAALHLSGYNLSLEELKRFRQWGSKTPGHPEHFVTEGVETTTGPLGQGFANGVGFAIADRFLAERYNRPHYEIVDRRVYAICSDGDLMEGITAEAASIAGHLGLGGLVYYYDDNHITIDGTTELSFTTEDKGKRFEAYGWHVQSVSDSEDLGALERATRAAEADEDRPSLIVVRSHIAYGAPHAIDTSKSHGAPLGEDEVRAAKEALGLDPDKHFDVPDEVYEHMDARPAGIEAEQEWRDRFERWAEAFPKLREDWEADRTGKPRPGWIEALPEFPAGEEVATRDAGKKVMQAFKHFTPTMIGGAADLVESTKTEFEGVGRLLRDPRGPQHRLRHPRAWDGRDRERDRADAGDAEALRLDLPDLLRLHAAVGAALGARPSAVGLGLDARLGRGRRGRPDARARRAPHGAPGDPEPLVRPARRRERDGARVADRARARGRPGCAGAVPPEADDARRTPTEGALRGAYTLWQSGDGLPELILIATGSEVGARVRGREDAWTSTFASSRCRAGSSSPSSPRTTATRCSRPDVRARLSVEAGISLGWERWVGDAGASVAIDRYGASAPGGEVLERLGFTVENVVERATALLERVAG